jgi:hypothetical protein
MRTTLLILALLTSNLLQAQVAINSDGSAPDASAMLDIVSTSKGILIPRVASTGDVTTPATGLLVYQTGGTAGFYYYNGATWTMIGAGSSSQWTTTGSDIYNNNAGGVGINTGAAPNASAALEIASTSKGILIPRMTQAQRPASSPATGLLIYQTDNTPGFYYYNGAGWTNISAGGTTGNLTEATSSVLTITGGTGAVMGSGTSIQVKQATTSTDGFLSSTNWNTFNGKESVLTFSSPLSRSTNTVSIPKATSSVNGYLASTDFSNFNSKWTKSGNALYFTNNVSIGTSTISNRLVVEDATDDTYSAIFRNTVNTSTGHVIEIQGGANGDISGTNLIFFTSPDGTPLGSVTQTSSGSVAFNTSSDSTLKENIRNTHYGLNDLLKIKVRDFNWKKSTQKKTITGFIAQELYEVYPNAITKPQNDKNKWMLSKEELIPLIVKSIQDQQNQIVELKTQLQTQQTQIDALLQRIQALEAK